eukprot:54351-Eustigmatos_ZCMA.PRE.1
MALRAQVQLVVYGHGGGEDDGVQCDGRARRNAADCIDVLRQVGGGTLDEEPAQIQVPVIQLVTGSCCSEVCRGHACHGISPCQDGEAIGARKANRLVIREEATLCVVGDDDSREAPRRITGNILGGQLS